GRVLVVIGVEWNRLGDGSCGIGRRELGATEQRRLRAVIELRNLAQNAFGRVAINNVAAGQICECAKTYCSTKEAPPAWVRHQFCGILYQKFRIDAGNDFALAHLLSLTPDNHCAQALWHDQRQRYMHDKKTDDRSHREKMHISS